MNTKLTFTFSLCFCLSVSLAQHKNDYIWPLGSPYPMDDPNNFVLDFNNKELRIYKYPLKLIYGTVNPNISNDEGRLIANSNGCIINNANGDLMENGNGLNPGFILQGNWCEQGYPGGNQSHFFLQDPGDNDILWLFHCSYSLTIDYPLAQYLRYSKLDMRANNGLGKVIEKNTVIVDDTLITFGEASGIKHINSRDWWIISPTGRPDTLFRTFLLTSDGLKGPFYQNIGQQISYLYAGGGGFKPNHQGTKLARYGDGDGVYLHDFDRTSGKLSNFIKIDTPSYYSLGGVEFSPSGRYLYVSTRRELFQYDMTAPDIAKSIIRIDSLDGFKTWTTVTFGNLQLGPDCRIYVVPTTSVEYFGVIHEPDNPGRSCDFRPHSIKLPSYNQLTRIYYPNYRMDEEPYCDKSIRFPTNIADYKKYLKTITCYLNSSSSELQISLIGELYNTSILEMQSTLGERIFSTSLATNQRHCTFPIQGISPGIYVLNLRDKTGIIGVEKVIIY